MDQEVTVECPCCYAIVTVLAPEDVQDGDKLVRNCPECGFDGEFTFEDE